MDGGLVSDLSLVNNDFSNAGSEHNGSSAPLSYTEIFYTKFPYYLSIGMTEEQYWDKDCALVRYYRQADELRKERLNQELWLQGMYVYDALSRLTPLSITFAKKGTKSQPYVDEPYPINKKTSDDSKKRKEKTNAQKGLRYMQAYMVQNNKQFEERK